MTEDRRKLLTLYLRECWHEHIGRGDCSCGSHYVKFCPRNRTFTTWQDMGDLKKKIVEMGEWRIFYRWAYDYAGSNLLNEGYTYEDDFCNWLMNPERFCELVAKWWKERRKG